MSIRADIERRVTVDAGRVTIADLPTRVRAVADAFRARVAGEEGAPEALRAALVDLAAVCEVVAEDV